MFGKTAKTGKLIVTGIACFVDPTGIALTAAGLDAAIHANDEWLKSKPDLTKLAAELEADFQTEIQKPSYDKPDQIRILLPQMLEAAFPDGTTLVEEGLDASLILNAMQKHLTNNEHCKHENLIAFEKAFLPLLVKACDDPRLISALQPAILRQQMRDTREMKALIQQVADGNIKNISLPDMVQLAEKFGEHSITDRTTLTNFLTHKATEYRALKAEVDAIPDSMKRLSNLKSAAQDAIARVDLDEVETLMAMVHETELDEAAKSAEIRANIALLRGKVDQAYSLLCAAADSFAPIDPLDPARRRILQYCKILWKHGLRYGGTALPAAEQITSPLLTDTLKAADPWLWAAGQNNLAAALVDQGIRTEGAKGTALLAEAVTAYRAALEVRTRADHPQDWATTQNNLANALATQGSRTEGAKGTALLGEAVTTCRAALEVRTRVDHPLNWATTQNNLANALRNQGSRTEGAKGTSLLAEAVTTYRAALEVCTRADHPVSWAETQNNIAITQLEIAGHDSCTDPQAALLAARAAVDKALTIYDPDHMSYRFTAATRLREDIQSRLETIPGG